ncbi:MAG: double-strand break repair helicase AddA, partial [Holosporales bacterium]|nr:double-strand break repair helicase AddA [Holosporales bacterium]
MALLTFQQKQAIDPQKTIWVTASAGSGKTKVLTDRLLTLLLSGTPPERLLCLTFTKAAAAEMANRLQKRLRNWGTLSEGLLKEEIEALGLAFGAEPLKRARQLFSQLLDTPGGFKIQTLHGFCQSLLSRFPLEAGLSPHFTVLDEIETQSLLKKAQESVFRAVDLGEDSDLSDALQFLVQEFSEPTLRSLITDSIKEGFALSLLPQEGEGFLNLARFLNTSEGLEEFWDCPSFVRSALETAISFLREGNDSDKERGMIVKQWLQTPQEKTFKKYLEIFLTRAETPRKSLASANLIKRFPLLADILKEEQERLVERNDVMKRQRVFQISSALLRLTLAIRKAYQRLKSEKAFLDYDDLIRATIRLLESPQGALWVLYKLDSGLDHVLIDEAQDTSPEQWRVIQGLVDAFLETPENSKTLFIVGDPKQSIYSFQGADPEAFSFMRRHIQEKLEMLRRPFREVSLDTSFRSAAVLLETVDQVFREKSALAGVATAPLCHKASRDLEGTVEIWPLLELSSGEEGTWDDPLSKDYQQPILPQVSLTQGIAKKIRQWLQEGETLTHKPLTPGDILILVRRRGGLMQALVKALKQEQIPVAGVDRMFLGDSLAALDLLKIAEFCLLPCDDLTLAVVLKGPFFRFSEEDLFKLAFGRVPVSLWARLRDSASLGDPFQKAYHLLKKFQEESLLRTPFSFFSFLLNELGGRHKIGERLGVDALEALDELLSLSMAYEKNYPPVLQTFLSWMRANSIQIKRDFEQGAQDEVRILTVHGSKGLEAPVVILPDTVYPPRDLPSLLWAQGKEGGMPFWNPQALQTPFCVQELKSQEQQRQLEEYNRLLYVAMTRSSERLYICGWKGEQSLSEKSWYHHVKEAVTKSPVFESFPFEVEGSLWKGEGWRYASPSCKKNFSPLDFSLSEDVLPSWIEEIPPLEKSPFVLTPSWENASTQSSRRSMDRGQLIHFLLERLAPLPDPTREDTGRKLLSIRGGQEEDLQGVLKLLRASHLSWLWQPHGLSEVSLIGHGEHEIISGRIDRLVLMPEEIFVVDFKTDKNPPSFVPLAYERQLFLYQKVLSALYQKPI